MPSPTSKTPPITALELLNLCEECDLSSKEGRSRFWRQGRARLPGLWQNQIPDLRDGYREKGFSVADSWRGAICDIASQLPSARDLPAGMLDAMRAEGSLDNVVVAESVPLPMGEPEPEPIDVMMEEAPPKKLKKSAAPDKKAINAGARTYKQVQDELVRAVRAKGKKGRCGMAEQVAWVSETLLVPLGDLSPDEIPDLGTLCLLIWARSNMTDFRKFYDCKRIPVKGFVADAAGGEVDDERPMADVVAQLKQAQEIVDDDALRSLSPPVPVDIDGAGEDEDPGQ